MCSRCGWNVGRELNDVRLLSALRSGAAEEGRYCEFFPRESGRRDEPT